MYVEYSMFDSSAVLQLQMGVIKHFSFCCRSQVFRLSKYRGSPRHQRTNGRVEQDVHQPVMLTDCTRLLSFKICKISTFPRSHQDLSLILYCRYQLHGPYFILIGALFYSDMFRTASQSHGVVGRLQYRQKSLTKLPDSPEKSRKINQKWKKLLKNLQKSV